MPLRTARRPVADAARLGVQPTCAANLGIHAGEENALFGHGVQVGCLETSNFLDRGDADVTEGSVVPHDVDDIGRPAILILQLRQLFVELIVLGRPFFTVLGIEDIVLGVVNDFCRSFCQSIPGKR